MSGKKYLGVEVLDVLTIDPPPIFIPPPPPPPIIDDTWRWRLLTSTDNPVRRIDAAMCSDGNGKSYLFGGATQPVIPGGVLPDNDFWVLDRATDQWTQLITSISPAKRSAHRITYMNGKIYLIGGTGWNDDFTVQLFFDDMWVYDIAANTWTDITTSTKIFQNRDLSFLVTDYPKGNAALEGTLFGQTAPNTLRAVVPAGNGSTKFNTYWEWTVASGDWTQIILTTELTLCLDRFVGGCWIGDKWVVIAGANFVGNVEKFIHHLTGTDWSQIGALTNPFPKREYSEAIWTGSQVFFYSGNTFPPGGGSTSSIFDEWIYDPSDGSFDDLSGVPLSPLQRCLHSLAWDGQRVVLFGGWRTYASGNLLGDSWVLENTL